MSARGQQPPSRPRNLTSALSPKADSSPTSLVVRFVPNAEVAGLFDNLVGAGEQRWRNGEAECFGGPEIDDQIETGVLLDRQIGWPLAIENAAGILPDQTPSILRFCPVAHKTPRGHALAIGVERWNCSAICQCN